MAEEKMRQQGFGAQGQSQRPEGSVTVENVKPKKPSKSIKGSDDDYIDYEVVE